MQQDYNSPFRNIFEFDKLIQKNFQSIFFFSLLAHTLHGIPGSLRGSSNLSIFFQNRKWIKVLNFRSVYYLNFTRVRVQEVRWILGAVHRIRVFKIKLKQLSEQLLKNFMEVYPHKFFETFIRKLFKNLPRYPTTF